MNQIFPKKIELLGETFSVKEVTKHDLICKCCDDTCLGKINWQEKTIYVAIDSEDSTPQEILLHELGHYFGEYYGISKSEIFADAFGKFVTLIYEQINI